LIRVSNSAEGCKLNPTASNYNSLSNTDAFIESASRPGNTPDAGNTPDGSDKLKNKRHSFSRKLVKELQEKKRLTNEKAKHGAHEAIVLKYLANRVGASKNIIDGKPWYYTTVRDLSTRFPYFRKSAIADIVQRLSELGYLEINNFNRHKYDRTFWYHVPQKIRNACEDDTIYFNSTAAREVGVMGAVLLGNFQYWIGQCEEKGIKDKRVLLQPAILEELLPFHKESIRRSIKDLIAGGFIRQVPTKMNWYTENNAEKDHAYLDKGHAYLDRVAANLDKGHAYLDNDTSCKSVSNSSETSSKENAPRLFSFCSYDDKNRTNSLVDSQQVANEGKDDGHNEPLVRHDEITPASPAFIDSLMGHEDILSTTVFSTSSGFFSSAHASSASTGDISGSPSNVDGEAPDGGELSHDESAHPASASTEDIPGAASDVVGAWPIPSYADLHQDNRTMDEQVKEWPKDWVRRPSDVI